MNMYCGKKTYIKKLIFITILFLAFSINVKAVKYNGCEYSDIARLKKAVNNVNLSYQYHISNSGVTFDITISNLVPNLYFIDSTSDIDYHYYDSNDGEITIYGYYGYKGSYDFYPDISECSRLDIGSKYYSFPTFNFYSIDPLCEGLENFSLCQRWAVVKYNSLDLEQKIYEYRHPKDSNANRQIDYEKGFFDDIIQFYLNNYIYILVSIIVVGGLLILIMKWIMKKTNKFEI